MIKGTGYIGAQYHFKQIVKPLAVLQCERLAATIAKVLEHGAGGRYHAVAVVAVAQGNGDQPA